MIKLDLFKSGVNHTDFKICLEEIKPRPTGANSKKCLNLTFWLSKMTKLIYLLDRLK